jgi:hypothetical protein
VVFLVMGCEHRLARKTEKRTVRPHLLRCARDYMWHNAAIYACAVSISIIITPVAHHAPLHTAAPTVHLEA